jgi:hypothetical protein
MNCLRQNAVNDPAGSTRFRARTAGGFRGWVYLLGFLGAAFPIQAQQPDLTITNLTGPNSGTLGAQISMTVNGRNQGTADASDVKVGFYFSTDATITTADTASPNTCTFVTLAQGVNLVCSGNIGVPNSLAPGTYFFGSIIDPQGLIAESNETNNARAADTGTITLSAAPNVPIAVSVTPGSGAGASQTFSFLYSDSNGFADMPWVQMVFNGELHGAYGCYVHYDRVGNQLLLMNDNVSQWLGPVGMGAPTTLENTQCTLNAAASSVSPSGNNLTVNLALSFKTGFGGAKKIFMQVTDTSANASGWQERGSWTPYPNVAPTAVSVSPTGGTGSTQTFSFVYADPNGFSDLPWVQMTMHGTLSGVYGCYTHYDRVRNLIFLLNDAGNGWIGPVTMGTASTLQNTQCTVNAQTSTSSGSGNNLTVNLALTFTQFFGGLKKIYLQSIDYGGIQTGWQERGTWTPFTNLPPVAGAINPASGSGTTQTFSFAVSDPNGFIDVSWVQMLINGSLTGENGCYTHYYPLGDQIFLYDSGTGGWIGPVIMGLPGTVTNNQCTVNAQTSSKVRNGTELTVNMSLTFKPAFAGPKLSFMQIVDFGGLATGWQQRGSWTVP